MLCINKRLYRPDRPDGSGRSDRSNRPDGFDRSDRPGRFRRRRRGGWCYRRCGNNTGWLCNDR